MAAVLDPRYKLRLVTFFFTKLDPLTCNEKVMLLRMLCMHYLESDVDIVGSSSSRGDVEMVDEMKSMIFLKANWNLVQKIHN